MPLPVPLSRLGLPLAPFLLASLIAGLLGAPAQATNIWSQGDAPSGPAVYAPPGALVPAAAQVSRPAVTARPVAPDFNRWAGGPGAGTRTGGFPFFCGNGLFSFGTGGGPGSGFAFGLFN